MNKARSLVQAVASLVDGAAGAFGIATEDGDEPVTPLQVCLDTLGDLARKRGAALDAGWVIERVADALARLALPGITERVDFRTGHLHDSDAMRVAALEQEEIHSRETGRAIVARVLVEEALDDGDETPTACVRSRRAQRVFEVLQQPRRHGPLSIVATLIEALVRESRKDVLG